MQTQMALLLRSHLNERHSLKFEWSIIALIAVQVTFKMVHYL